MKKALIVTHCALALALAAGGAFASDEQSAAALESVSALSSNTGSPAKSATPASAFYGGKKKATPPVESDDGDERGNKVKGESLQKGKLDDSVADGSDIGVPATEPDMELGGQVAMPEVTQRAIFSRSDVNRVVCRTPIKDVNYSEEKGVLVKITGKNAFVKFRVEKVDGKVNYTKMPMELFISCGDAVYNLVAIPKAVPSQTIRLESGRVAKAKENISLFKEQTIKKKVIGLIKRAYLDDIPESFTVTAENKVLRLFQHVGVIHRRTITVDGEGLVLKEFQVTPVGNGIELEEKSFIRKEISDNPLAIAFDRLKVLQGEKARLFVVELRASLVADNTEEEDAE